MCVRVCVCVCVRVRVCVCVHVRKARYKSDTLVPSLKNRKKIGMQQASSSRASREGTVKKNKKYIKNTINKKQQEHT